MKFKILMFLFIIIFSDAYSQRKDTVFIILQDSFFSHSINDTLVIDKRLGWIDKKNIGKIYYPNLENLRCLTGAITDTIVMGKDIESGKYMISKSIYPTHIESEKENLRKYLKVVDSCDNLYKTDEYLTDKTGRIYIDFNKESLSKTKMYKCYHQNLAKRNINLSPYSFWRNDSMSDKTIVMDSVKTKNKITVIKSDARIYKTLSEIEKICNSKDQSQIKCFRLSSRIYPNLGLSDFEKLNMRNYEIYINESFVPGHFPKNSDGEKKIILNQYHFREKYNQYR